MESGSKRASIFSEPVRYMDKLDEFILIEILLLLPSVNSVTQCKLVCRHWNSVISCPHFTTRFLKYRMTKKKEFSMILADQCTTRCTYTLLSNDSNFQNFDYNFAVSILESTPCNHTTLDLEILATYNELVLYLHRYRCDSDVSLREIIMKFYVYNPLTEQHVALPPSPRRSRYMANAVLGFLCRGQSSFRVVHILRSYFRDPVRMHIFSSEENKWTEYILGAVGHTMVSYRCVMAVPWNGLLCWMSHNDSRLIVCNPYSPDDQHFHFITPPVVKRLWEDCSLGVGVFRGTLRLWGRQQGLFSVWELKDYSTEEWSLKHEVHVGMYTHIRAAAFDPNDEDVAYYATYSSLFSLNMRSGDSSPVKASHKTEVNLPRFDEKEPSQVPDMKFFMLVMAGFPTPIPQNDMTWTESQDRGLETSKGKEA